jgi:DNA-binding transcriptional LysR family regulator
MSAYTLKQIKTFQKVATLQSISKAANALFVTQPAVTQQIKQLEEAFGQALIEPFGRTVQLTESGKIFFKLSETLLANLADLEETMSNLVNLEKGHIRLGIVSTTKYFVPMLMMEFKKVYPAISFDLKIAALPKAPPPRPIRGSQRNASRGARPARPPRRAACRRRP